MKEEEKRKLEENERKMEERIRLLERQIEELKDQLRQPITSLDAVSVTFPDRDNITRQGNSIVHSGAPSYRNCFVGDVLTSV